MRCHHCRDVLCLLGSKLAVLGREAAHCWFGRSGSIDERRVSGPAVLSRESDERELGDEELLTSTVDGLLRDRFAADEGARGRDRSFGGHDQIDEGERDEGKQSGRRNSERTTFKTSLAPPSPVLPFLKQLP